MSQVKVQFSGSVVAEPTLKQVGQSSVLEFPVYVNDQKPDGSGGYVDTGDVTKIRVSLWGEMSGMDVQKGDIVEIDGSIVEKEFEKRDGTQGRSIQTKFVNSLMRKWRKDDNGFGGAQSAPVASGGFDGFPTI